MQNKWQNIEFSKVKYGLLPLIIGVPKKLQ